MERDGRAERLRGHRQYVDALASGRRLASGAWDNTVWIWDTSVEPAAGRPLHGHEDAVLVLAWSPDGRHLYSGDRQGTLRRWSDGLSDDPEELRMQIRAMVDALDAGRPLTTAASNDVSPGAPPASP